MKFLLLGLNYKPEPVGIGPYTTGLAEALADRGHDVTVVCGKPYYPQWRPYPGQGTGVIESFENGVRVIRVPHYIPANPSGVKRIAHHISFARSAFGPMMKEARKGADIVFTVAPSLLSVPVASAAAKAASAPLWLHIQDFEVEAAIATGLISGGSVAARAAAAVEIRILASADFVSTISPQMRLKLVTKGIPENATFELRNWSNAVFANIEADEAAYRRDWQIGKRHVALYSGNIANKQGLDVVIEAARRLSGRNDILFVICGEGPNREALKARAAGMENIQFHDLQPVERMGGFLSLASVHLLPQIVDAADLVLPSKLTNMLASGRPVIATAVPGTGLYEEVSGCGLLTPPGDADALAGGIARLVDDPALRTELGVSAAERASSRWSMPSIIEGMEQRAVQIVNARP